MTLADELRALITRLEDTNQWGLRSHRKITPIGEVEIKHMIGTLRALADRAEAIEKDAERYRFIRRGDRGTYDHVLIYTDGTLDRTVDAAIANESKP